MLNKNLALVLISVLFTALACGQFEFGIEATPTTLPDPQVYSTTQEKPEEHLLSDQTKNSVEEELDNTTQFMAYTDSNSNIWVLEIGSGTPRQITFDAYLIDGTNTAIEYSSPKVSSDGTLLVFSKEVGDPRVSGYDFTSGLWVENLVTGEKQQILSGRTMGFSWKPESHELAYTTAIEDMDYWIPPGQPSPDLATGINLIDLDNNETIELVQPERGYALSGPEWTVDGKIIYFTEVVNMEGSGMFAYYDLENKNFVAWEEPVGHVSWSQDGDLITYARHTYSPSGDERIYIRSREGVEQLIGPDYEGAPYATQPVFSPTENKLAYFVFEGGPLTSSANIMLLDLDGGDPSILGIFEDVWDLAWTLDGNNLIFSSGNLESRDIILLSLIDGSYSIIANGRQLSLTGQ